MLRKLIFFCHCCAASSGGAAAQPLHDEPCVNMHLKLSSEFRSNDGIKSKKSCQFLFFDVKHAKTSKCFNFLHGFPKSKPFTASAKTKIDGLRGLSLQGCCHKENLVFSDGFRALRRKSIFLLSLLCCLLRRCCCAAAER